MLKTFSTSILLTDYFFETENAKPTFTSIPRVDFDNGGSAVKGCNGCFVTNNSREPTNLIKGDIVRMLFYVATRYEKGDRVELDLNDVLNNGENPYDGKLSVLQSHESDPVD